MTLRDTLDAGSVLVADGATGTMLQAVGLAMGQAPERWTLENPEAIRALAAGYANAGSDIIYTNTFGGNLIRLRLSGLDEQIAEINAGAVRLAREAIAASGRRRVFLVASIGPTGEMLDPYGELSADEAREAFAGQARLLKEAGVDGFACETFTGLEEALLCLGAVKEIADGLPVFASMAFETSGRTMMGVKPDDAARELSAAGADVVGANCSVGPEVVENGLRAMAAAVPGLRLLGKPNAGLPRVEGGRTVYSVSPEDMGAFAKQAIGLGARVLGGCCGSTPDHIRAIRIAVDSL
jgi:5-methyltetrahydrofolate--homocysteine methyltransferase